MNPPPAAIAFDAIETLFSIETLRGRLTAAGLEAHLLEVWFARLLRDAFALGATGVYKPFSEIAAAALARLPSAATKLNAAGITAVVDGFAALGVQPDAAPAMQALRHADIRMLILTNGNAETTQKLLERAGLDSFIERVDTSFRWYDEENKALGAYVRAIRYWPPLCMSGSKLCERADCKAARTVTRGYAEKSSVQATEAANRRQPVPGEDFLPIARRAQPVT